MLVLIRESTLSALPSCKHSEVRLRLLRFIPGLASACQPAVAAATGGRRAGSSCFSFSDGQLRARNYWATGWLVSLDPSRCACRNDLNRDVLRLDVALITHQVYVPAAYIGEALACVVNDGCAVWTVSLVHGKFPSYDRDKARARMGMPPSVRPRFERVSRYVNV